MRCVKCGCEEWQTIDSRHSDSMNTIRRIKECMHCHIRIRTHEYIDAIKIEGKYEQSGKVCVSREYYENLQDKAYITEQMANLIKSNIPEGML